MEVKIKTKKKITKEDIKNFVIDNKEWFKVAAMIIFGIECFGIGKNIGFKEGRNRGPGDIWFSYSDRDNKLRFNYKNDKSGLIDQYRIDDPIEIFFDLGNLLNENMKKDFIKALDERIGEYLL